MENISLKPMKELTKSRGLKLYAIADAIGIGRSYFRDLVTDRAAPKTDTIAKIACFFKVPVSQIVELSGIEYKPNLERKIDTYDLTYVESPLGLPSYQPLRDYIADFYKDKEVKRSLDDVLDHVQKDQKYTKINARDNITKALAARGIDIDNPKHERTVRPGMSSTNRNKIKHDLPVTMSVIYNICKTLKCNIDFVFTWR